MARSVLQVSNLTVEYPGDPPLLAVDALDLTLDRGEALGLVGESGSGKSTVALAVLNLVPGGARVSGEVLFCGDDLLAMTPSELRRVRGARVAMAFQDPASALNPVLRVGDQLAEVMRAHLGLGRVEARDRAARALGDVGIPSPEDRARAYPHELSGGTRQRAMLAMALACEPELLLADEPTTSVDPTLQAQLLELLRATQARTRMAVLFISHDLAVVASLCHRVMVMKEGQAVDQGALPEAFEEPRHDYTRYLVDSARALGEG